MSGHLYVQSYYFLYRVQVIPSLIDTKCKLVQLVGANNMNLTKFKNFGTSNNMTLFNIGASPFPPQRHLEITHNTSLQCTFVLLNAYQLKRMEL